MKTINLINRFKAEWPEGYQSIDGVTRVEFNIQCLMLACHSSCKDFYKYLCGRI